MDAPVDVIVYLYPLGADNDEAPEHFPEYAGIMRRMKIPFPIFDEIMNLDEDYLTSEMFLLPPVGDNDIKVTVWGHEDCGWVERLNTWVLRLEMASGFVFDWGSVLNKPLENGWHYTENVKRMSYEFAGTISAPIPA